MNVKEQRVCNSQKSFNIAHACVTSNQNDCHHNTMDKCRNERGKNTFLYVKNQIQRWISKDLIEEHKFKKMSRFFFSFWNGQRLSIWCFMVFMIIGDETWGCITFSQRQSLISCPGSIYHHGNAQKFQRPALSEEIDGN